MISQDKPQEARTSLQWLRGQQYDITIELSDMESIALMQRKQKLKAKELISMSNVRPFIASVGLMLFQQLSGINAVMFYSVSIFKTAGSSIDSNLATIILGVVNICATIVSNVLVDKVGRKMLLYVSDAGMILSLGVFGAYFYIKDVAKDIGEPPGWIPLIALVVYVVSFSIGFGPIPWLMMGEVFPSRIRGAAASIATTFNWACTFLVTKTFMDLQVFGTMKMTILYSKSHLLFRLLWEPTERFGCLLAFALPAYFSSFSSCRKRKGKLWRKSKTCTNRRARG